MDGYNKEISQIIFKISYSIMISFICTIKGLFKGVSQVTKSIWWMPWHVKSMKDVVSCDKLRGDANNL